MSVLVTNRAKLLDDPAARVLAAGDMRAIVLPHAGMLVASLVHRGDELLGRVDDLDAAARRGATVALPLMHPWANRLAGSRYRAAGREVRLDLASPLLSLDANGLPIHGVPWSRLAWRTVASSVMAMAAELDWSEPALLAVFPFRHRLRMTVSLAPDRLRIETTLAAGPEGPVPASFGFHPYLAPSPSRRETWRLELPAMVRLALDSRKIPTGERTRYPGFDRELGDLEFDDGFALEAPRSVLAIEGGGRRIAVVLDEGFDYAQVYAPPGKPFVALEPMTAPANALSSGEGVRVVPPGEAMRTSFEVVVTAA